MSSTLLGQLLERHALLFAGDRFESRDVLTTACRDNDLVVLDRYVASNIAHQGAKLPAELRADIVERIARIEFDIYQLPPADLVVLLDLPAADASLTTRFSVYMSMRPTSRIASLELMHRLVRT